MRVHLVQTNVESYQRVKRVLENIIEFTETALFTFTPGAPVLIQARDALLVMQLTVTLPLTLFDSVKITQRTECLVNIPLMYSRLKMCDGKKSQWGVGQRNARLYIWSMQEGDKPQHPVRALPDQHSRKVSDIVALFKEAQTSWPARVCLNASTLSNALLDLMVGCGETFCRYFDHNHIRFGSVFENGEIYMDVPLVDDGAQTRWPEGAQSANYVTRLLKVVSSILMHHQDKTVELVFQQDGAAAHPAMMFHMNDGIEFWTHFTPYVGPFGVPVEEVYRLFAIRNV